MITCAHCSKRVPLRYYLFSLRLLKLKCPSCGTMLIPSRSTRRLFYFTFIPIGILAGLAVILRWSDRTSIVLIILAGIIAGGAYSVLSWLKGDFKPADGANKEHHNNGL